MIGWKTCSRTKDLGPDRTHRHYKVNFVMKATNYEEE